MSHSDNLDHKFEKLLDRKVVIITGGGRGIGASAAELFARHGASLVLAARTEAELKTTSERVSRHGVPVTYVVADVSTEPGVTKVVNTALQTFGRLDVAYNNAGVAVPGASIANGQEADFDVLFGANTRATWLLTKYEAQAIRSTSGTGSILNSSSVASRTTNPAIALYAAAKIAVNKLTAAAAAEFGPQGIRVNAIAPGATATSMLDEWEQHRPGVVDAMTQAIPLRRVARPEEIAEAALWLLSDKASYVTGAIVPVDGGRSA